MKKTIVYSALCLLAAGTAMAQQKFIVQGKLKDLKEEVKVMFIYPENGAYKQDSAITQKGVFSFTGNTTGPVKAQLQCRPLVAQPLENMTIRQYMNPDVQELFLYNGTTKVAGTSIRTATITGGKTQEELNALNTLLKPTVEKRNALLDSMDFYNEKRDTTARFRMGSKMRDIDSEAMKIQEDFIRAHNSSYVSLDLLRQRTTVIDPETFEPLFNVLSAELKKSAGGKSIAERLDLAKRTSIGKPAVNFTQNMQNDQPFTLASLKGKYVLVDFWASWCGPCRAENPNVVKVYNEFKNKNFEIVGVSLDTKKEAWLAAIEKDGLPWIHVSDLNGWQNVVGIAYGISAVPQNFLLDPNGLIIGKNLQGEALGKKLAQVLQ